LSNAEQAENAEEIYFLNKKRTNSEKDEITLAFLSVLSVLCG
jgi:hypothetical protein